MKLIRALVRQFRRAICFFFGHGKADVSLSNIGFKMCRRCLRLTDQKTVRRETTRGDIERRMAARPPKGYSFLSCNWKKRKAKFVSPSEKAIFVLL
jgi:hypothetical protein